jgi:hypothetical protein
MGYLDTAHRIHVEVNNCQTNHHYTMLETSRTVANQTLNILIDVGAIKSFIYGAKIKIIKVKEVKQDEFIFVELASGDKQKVGRKVTSCSLNLEEIVTRANLYVMILRSYDIMIDMDWLESHEAILNYKMKWFILVDDEGKRCVIMGQNQGASLRFISSLQLQKIMHKGYNIYVILALNEKGVEKVLENLPAVRIFANVFPEELPRMSWERDLEFTIDLKLVG